MRHKIIAAALESFDPEGLLHKIQPLGRIHGHLDQAVRGDFVLLHSLFKICCCLFFTLNRIADLEQMTQALLFAHSPGVGIVGVPVKRIRAQRAQDLHQAGYAFDP